GQPYVGVIFVTIDSERLKNKVETLPGMRPVERPDEQEIRAPRLRLATGCLSSPHSIRDNKGLMLQAARQLIFDVAGHCDDPLSLAHRQLLVQPVAKDNTVKE